jgi:hypothetical protein
MPIPDSAYLFPQIERHRYHDRSEPGGKGGIAPELAQPFEGSDKRLLGGVFGILSLAKDAVGEPVDPLPVLVEQRAGRCLVTRAALVDQLSFGQFRPPLVSARQQEK